LSLRALSAPCHQGGHSLQPRTDKRLAL